MKIQAKIKRNGKEANPNSLGKVLSDNIQDIVEDVLSGLLDGLGVSAQGVHGGGGASSGGSGATGFDELHKQKKQR